MSWYELSGRRQCEEEKKESQRGGVTEKVRTRHLHVGNYQAFFCFIHSSLKAEVYNPPNLFVIVMHAHLPVEASIEKHGPQCRRLKSGEDPKALSAALSSAVLDLDADLRDQRPGAPGCSGATAARPPKLCFSP